MKCVAFFVVTLLFNQCLQINANPKRSNAAKSNKNLPDQQTDDTYPGKPIAAQDALMTINEYSKAILEAGVQLGYSIGAMDQSLLNVEEMDKVKAYIVEKMADLKDPFETHQVVNLPNSKRVALERGEKKRKPIKERLVRSASELSMVGTRKVKREVTQTIETSVPQKHENDGNVKSRSGTKNRFGLFNWFGNNLFGKIIRPYTGGYNNVGYVKPNRPNLSFTIAPVAANNPAPEPANSSSGENSSGNSGDNSSGHSGSNSSGKSGSNSDGQPNESAHESNEEIVSDSKEIPDDFIIPKDVEPNGGNAAGNEDSVNKSISTTPQNHGNGEIETTQNTPKFNVVTVLTTLQDNAEGKATTLTIVPHHKCST